MAATGASSVKVHRNKRGFMTVLTFAVCEWFLIFLLFIDAVLSYFLTKFASYCKLQTPCLLCSRLDHVLGNEKPEFYRTLLCSSHKSEISSLISCQIHGKLADGHGMCEDCLLSFATKNKAISESHRLFGAKLGFDFSGHSSFQSPLLNKDFVSGSSGTRPCSCCNKLWSSRQHAQRSFQLKSTGSGATKPNIPLPRMSGRNRLNRRDSLKRMRAKFYGSVTSQRLGSIGFDPLSEVGYTELKITSDSESEVPFSDDDDGSGMVREKNDCKQAISIQHVSEVLPKSLCDDLAPVKQDHQSVKQGPSLLEPLIQCDVGESHDVKCFTSDISIGHGLSELKWQQADQEFNPHALPELLSVNDILPSSNVLEVHSQELSELISFDDFPPTVNIIEAPVGASSKNYLTGLDHVGSLVHAEVLISTHGAGFKSDQVPDNAITSKPDYVDPSMSSKSVVNNMGRESSSSFTQQVAIKDPDKVNLTLLHSAAQGVDLSSNNTSPRVEGHDDEVQIAEASSSNGVKMLHKSDYIDRDESGLESLDGSTVSEIDGESVVDRLKRQVEYDRKCVSSLYKELEEERNASAIAANQAMAMITRLQEEKAALHMEALQYLRMMEEQAEYDVEALEKANDLLAEKEKEMQDLEAELELYRNEYADDSTVDNIPEDSCNLKVEKMMVKNTPTTSCFKDVSGISAKSMTSEAFKDDDKPCDAKNSWLEFEDEKVYISQCLKKLERKLHGVLGNGASVDIPNGGYYENVANGVKDHEEFLNDEGIQIGYSMEENGVSMPKVLSVSNGIPLSQGGASVGDNHFVGQENNNIDSDGQKSSIHLREVDLVAFENEVSDLNARIEALEANRDFLEHALNTLQNGKEGLQFIQEITHQLQELRKIELRQRCQSVL